MDNTLPDSRIAVAIPGCFHRFQLEKVRCLRGVRQSYYSLDLHLAEELTVLPMDYFQLRSAHLVSLADSYNHFYWDSLTSRIAQRSLRHYGFRSNSLNIAWNWLSALLEGQRQDRVRG